MFVVGKVVYGGIIFLLLTPWISGPSPTPVDSGTSLSSEMPAETDVQGMQQILQDGGHYHGKIDGVFGLRTRASIRVFQKAENLPVTGELDAETASKLGVRPESHHDTGYDTTQDKPTAGIEWARGSKQTRKTRPKTVQK